MHFLLDSVAYNKDEIIGPVLSSDGECEQALSAWLYHVAMALEQLAVN